MDYVFRWLAQRFLPKEDQPATPAAPVNSAEIEAERGQDLENREREVFVMQADAPPCHECGSLMVRNGACYACVNCGATSGCS